MAKFILEYDSETRTGTLKMNGADMPDLKEVHFYYYGEEGAVEVVQFSELEEDVRQMVRTMAAQGKPKKDDKVTKKPSVYGGELVLNEDTQEALNKFFVNSQD